MSYILIIFAAEAACPAFKPNAVVWFQLDFGAQTLYDIARVKAQGGRDAYQKGHQRTEDQILQTVSVLVLQKTVTGVLIGDYQPAEIHAAPMLADLEMNAMAKAFRPFADEKQDQGVYRTDGRNDYTPGEG